MRLLPSCVVVAAVAACSSTPQVEPTPRALQEYEIVAQWDPEMTFLMPAYFVDGTPARELTLGIGGVRQGSHFHLNSGRSCPSPVIRVGADGVAKRAIKLTKDEAQPFSADCLALPFPERALPNKR